jgi:mannose-1-phosphate guanylyltransferase
MIALIMAGGIGTRFWPLSNEKKPKQFLSILSDRSMLQMTVDRLLPKIDMENIYIVTAESQVQLVKEHLPELPEKNIIIEPFGMNTAPCIALSALYLEDLYDKDETMFVLPADHLIKNTDEFLRTLQVAEKAAQADNLVTFGIKPHYPATGYGYIEAGEKIEAEQFSVKQFKEKPNRETAEQFLNSGNFFWNSGMFVWKLETILHSFQQFAPPIHETMNSIRECWQEKGKQADLSNIYKTMPKLPIDIAIMEKAEKRVVIPVDYGWSDVGSWQALYDVSVHDENKNVIHAKHISIESSGNYVYTQKPVALIGIEDLVIIESDDAILITKKERSEEVKSLANQL